MVWQCSWLQNVTRSARTRTGEQAASSQAALAAVVQAKSALLWLVDETATAADNLKQPTTPVATLGTAIEVDSLVEHTFLLQ